MTDLQHSAESVIPLSPEVKEGISKALHVVVPIWLAEDFVDYRRVVRSTGQGSGTISVEPYRGARTWMSFNRKIEMNSAVTTLEGVIMAQKPQLLGTVSFLNSCMQIQGATALLTASCSYVEKRMAGGEAMERAISSALEVMDHVLATQEIEFDVVSPLGGLSLPESAGEIRLNQSAVLRKISDKEYEDFSSSDIHSQEAHGFSEKRALFAVAYNGKAPYRLSAQYGNESGNFVVHERVSECIKQTIQTIHLLKEGRISLVASYWRVRPIPLPLPGQFSTGAFNQNPFCNIVLSDNEVSQIQEKFRLVASIQRDQLNIALDRLVDAESRLSPVDSLLDSVIGLEALLKPQASGELAFRVALNYAYLSANPDERRRRYDSLHEIQKTRNDIVHAGHNLKSGKAAIITQNAELAKKCLRDAINRFLHDPTIKGDLSAKFWLDRILPLPT